jgi:hypothetical protein
VYSGTSLQIVLKGVWVPTGTLARRFFFSASSSSSAVPLSPKLAGDGSKFSQAEPIGMLSFGERGTP